jgi:hypothetical protein
MRFYLDFPARISRPWRRIIPRWSGYSNVMDFAALLTSAFGGAVSTRPVAPDELDRLRGVFPEEFVRMWSLAGFAEYAEGCFTLLDPEQVAPMVAGWPGLSPGNLPFARDGFGNLFLVVAGAVHRLDVHRNVLDLVTLDVPFFFDMKIFNPSFAADFLESGLHLRIRSRLGPTQRGEIFSFAPALAMGGTKNVKSARKVQFLEHLHMLAQLHE